MTDTKEYFTLYKNSFPKELAERFIEKIDQLFPKERSVIVVYGRKCVVGRDQLWLSRTGKSYTYSGSKVPSVEWTELEDEICEFIYKLIGCRFDSLLINRYEGKDSVGWHSDNEKTIDQTKPIISISIGATRDFDVRPISEKKNKTRFKLEDGDIVVMSPNAQKLFQHCVPPRLRVKEKRYNITARVYKL